MAVARTLTKLRWKTVFVATFFFILGNLITLFFIPIHEQCTTRVSKTESKSSSALVILILTAPHNLVERNTIRDTWLKLSGNLRKKPDRIDVKHYFVIGDSELSELDKSQIKKENSRYGDVLILPIHDLYDNLTKKLMLSLDWLIAHDVEFKYILKCDDDSFVRLDHLVHELIHLDVIYSKSIGVEDVGKVNENSSPYLSVNVQKNDDSSSEGTRGLYWGYMNGAATVFRKGKWKEPSWVLCDHYVPYALGGGYVISRSLVKYIARNKEDLRFYRAEDVSVGTWLAPMNNIVRIHDRRFDTEYKSRGCQNYYLIRHKLTTDEIKATYAHLRTKGRLCPEETRSVKEYLYDWSVRPSKCCNRIIE